MPDLTGNYSAAMNPAGGRAPRRGALSLVTGILVAVTTVLIVMTAMTFDSSVSHWVLADATPQVKRTAHFLSKSGEGQWPIGVGLVIMSYRWKTGRRDWRRAGMVIALATALAGLAAISVRSATGRARPCNRIEQGWFGPYRKGKWTALQHPYSSFPSGHSATAAGFAVAFTLVTRRWGWISLFWMVGVGWSRICLESHYFSDVIAGYLFGLAAALLVMRAFGWPRVESFSNEAQPAAKAIGAGA